jgi:3-dehydroquinate synthase
MMNTKVYFKKSMPALSNSQNCIVIFDRKITKQISPWKNQFKKTYAITAGENLKSVEKFAGHIRKITQLSSGISRNELTIVAVGGGSVGDFAGFVASILKRGVKLIHIPSTWLAAIDSAHGGKTALNVAGIKNQIGTFYPANEIYLVQSLLQGQPAIRAVDAWGEVVKTALISGQSWSARVLSDKNKNIWKWLPYLVATKYDIVKRDPFETKGLRYYLNLGHTMGHVIESQLKWSHGRSVLYGVRFALEWSYSRGVISTSDYDEIKKYLPEGAVALRKLKNISAHLLQDKKMSHSKKLQFVFIKKPGVLKVEPVHVNDISKEWKRQVHA